MSLQGPTLRRDKRGYTFSKFNGRVFRFGRATDPETRVRFQAFKARWEQAGRKLTPEVLADRERRAGPAGSMTIRALVECYQAARETEVVKSEWQRLRCATAPMVALYADEPARAFGPRKLRLVRERMEDSGTLCRTEINRRITKLRGLFKWGVAEELVPVSVHQSLCTLAPLKKGRTKAREARRKLPAPPRDIVRALRCMTPTLAAMVRLQLKTGMRPGEVVAMRRANIDRCAAGGTWVYEPDSHKNAHRDMTRRVPLGPKAQAILEPFLAGGPEGFVFSARRSEQERKFLMRQRRKTPLTPSQRRRDQERADNPRREIADRWTTETYRHAVEHACKAAGASPWTPSQLRKNYETMVERRFGVEAASKALGHADIGTTQHYRDLRDLSEARRVAKAIG